MTNSSQPPKTVTYRSKSKLVSYPPPSSEQARTIEALLLRALADDRVDCPESSPSVALSRSPLQKDEGPSYTNRSLTGVLMLDMGNNLEELGETLLPASHIPSPSLLRTRKLSLHEAYLHQLLANWESKDEMDKLLIMANAMTSEKTQTFTVDLSEGRQRSLGADLTLAFQKIRNELATITALGPTLITLEHDDGDRLHLHGMVMSDVPRRELRKLLLKIGGVSGNIHFENLHQIKIKPATSSLGWGLYMIKEMHRLAPSDRKGLIFASNDARRLGISHLEDLRAASIRKLGIKPEFRGRSALRHSRSGTTHRGTRRQRSGGGDHKVGFCFTMPTFAS